MALTFAFSPERGETPASIKRKRDIAEALMMSRGAPRNIGEGLNALGDGIVAAVMGRRADKAEREGIEGANSAFSPILAALGGGDFPSAPAAPSSGSVASKPDDPRVGSTIDFARGEASGVSGGGDIAELESYIRESATRRGIDPDIAVRVARSEGLAPGVWQSNVVKNGRRETSYGPFQLLVGGGLGDKFQKLYGKSPADPSTVRQQIDFALDEAATGGWGPWYGAAKVGVGRRTGLENARALGVQGTQVASLDPSIGLPEEETAGISFTPPEQPAPAPAPAQIPAPAPSMVQPQPRQQVAQALTEERSPMSGRSDLPGLGTLLGAANNQFLSPSQSAIIEALTGQRLKEMDPMTGLQRRKMELELRNLENPPVDPADVLAREKFQFEKEQAGKLTPAEEARLKLDREKFEADQKKLMELGAGTTVFDPETRQPVFTSPKEETKPSAVLEYEYAKEQGFPGTFQDWEASKKGGMSLQVDPETGAVTFQQGGNIKPMTEGQSKDAVFSTRAEGALPLIDQFGDALTNFGEGVLGQTPMVGNFMKSKEFQQAEQAGKEFLQAILRKDTGAAITAEETAEYGSVYLPRPGDSPEVLAQKKASRIRALEAIKAGMPPQAILAQEKALEKAGQPEKPAKPLSEMTDEELEAIINGQ